MTSVTPTIHYKSIKDPLPMLHARAAFHSVYDSVNKDVKPPRLGSKCLDLFILFDAVCEHGGIDKIYADRSFGLVSARLRLPLSATNAGYSLNKTYRKIILPIEKDLITLTMDVFTRMEHLTPNPKEELSESEKAVVEARMKVHHMEEREVAEENFVECVPNPDLYLNIRNHIIRMWYRNLNKRISWEEIMNDVPTMFRALAKSVFNYLEREGIINFGILPMTRSFPLVKKKKKVLVIGAGIAGLIAARHLKSFGCEVLIIEANSKPGGRCVSMEKEFGVPADSGAMLITGVEQNPITVLCKQLNTPLHTIRLDCPLYDIDGQVVDKADDQFVETKFNAILDKTCKERSSKKKLDDRSLAEDLKDQIQKDNNFLKEGSSPVHHRLASWHIANLEYGCATLLDKVSGKCWDQDDPYAFSGDHVLLKSGFESVIHGMKVGLDIRLNSVAREIIWKKNKKVQVTLETGEVEIGDILLMTASLGVLQSNLFQFSPSLPQWKQQAIAGLGFGTLNKVILKFEKMFWENDKDCFGILQPDFEERGDFYMIWNMYQCYNAPILIMMIIGKNVQTFEQCSDDIVVSKALAVLQRIFPVVPAPVASYVSHWTDNRFFRGAYSYVPVGSSGDDYDLMAKPVDQTLYFAGEHCSREHPTTCSGSMTSALRAAAAIIKDHQLDNIRKARGSSSASSSDTKTTTIPKKATPKPKAVICKPTTTAVKKTISKPRKTISKKAVLAKEGPSNTTNSTMPNSSLPDQPPFRLHFVLSNPSYIPDNNNNNNNNIPHPKPRPLSLNSTSRGSSSKQQTINNVHPVPMPKPIPSNVILKPSPNPLPTAVSVLTSVPMPMPVSVHVPQPSSTDISYPFNFYGTESGASRREYDLQDGGGREKYNANNVSENNQSGYYNHLNQNCDHNNYSNRNESYNGNRNVNYNNGISNVSNVSNVSNDNSKNINK